MRNVKLTPIALAIALATPVALAIPATASAKDCCAAQNRSTIHLSSYGEVKQAPDMATISAGVQSDAITAKDAMAKNRRQMARVFATLKAAGIAEKDIQTSNLNLHPQWRHQKGVRPKVIGYKASNTVTVIVRDLGKIGPAIDAIVDAGSNQLNGVNFGISNPEAALDKARQQAAERLRAKAQLYARTMGYRVGKIVTMNESGGQRPAPQYKMARAAMADMAMESAPTPVAAGQMTMRVSLNATFELVR